jgi:hypothetical protein
MYCSQCGIQTADDALYCHGCGSVLYRDRLFRQGRDSCEPSVRPMERPVDEEYRRIAAELLPIDQKPDQCHYCGRREHLRSWDFGLAKKISAKRVWARTAVSLAMSVVSLPLAGYGVFSPPGTLERLKVLRLQLILCEACWRAGRSSFSLHPWWAAANRLGYSRFLDADALGRLQPDV